MLDRRRRHGEVDDGVGGADRRARIGDDLHALEAGMAVAHAGDLAGLAAQHVTARSLEGAGQGGALGAGDLADQHLAHAAGGAGDGDLHVFPHVLLRLD